MTREISVAASGLLAEFSGYGVLDWADVHPANHLCHLFGERDERVALAASLAVRALRAGSLCIDIASAAQDVSRWEPGEDLGEGLAVPDEAWPPTAGWLDALRASPAVTVGDAAAPPRPFRLVGGLLYLERYWADQESVRSGVLRQLGSRPAPLGVARQAPSGDARMAAQDAAVDSALTHGLTVIAGGPGTGKTHVIAQIVRAFTSGSSPALVGLAAPTGKAAARMTESLRGESERVGLPAAAKASTLHRLLGWRPGSRSRFAHDRSNPLPHDVVIVDELSMVSMTLMARLLDALKPGSRLVLVGDPDQLASVEAGAVLADLTSADALRPAVVRLEHNFRFSGAIATLADAIRHGDTEAALAVLTATGGDAVRLIDPADAQALLRARCVEAGAAVFDAARRGQGSAALAALERHRLLCAHRRGPYGVQHWSSTVASWLAEGVPGYSLAGEFYVGRPLLMTRNAAELEVYNGDTGVVVKTPEGTEAVFGTGLGPRTFSPYLLDGLSSVHAMTVHKSQGSQFAQVSAILPPVTSPLLTRELLYTAVTRASAGVVLVGTPDAVRAAIERPTARTSGLRERLR